MKSITVRVRVMHIPSSVSAMPQTGNLAVWWQSKRQQGFPFAQPYKNNLPWDW
jgi:hypothetical protein